MPSKEIVKELTFGLENLVRVHAQILSFVRLDASEPLKTSALTYECVGYYNALEHLIIRVLKYLQRAMPSGEFSHRDTLRAFEVVLRDFNLGEPVLVSNIETLMAFRHVATKIYGFLIDWEKLKTIINTIQANHADFVSIFREIQTQFETEKQNGD